jgi:amidase
VLPEPDALEMGLLDPIVRTCLESAVGYPATSFTRAWDRRLSEARDVAMLWVQFDVLLTPAVARAPLRLGEGRDLPPEELVRLWVELSPFTSMWNLTGQPALSIPFGFDEERRPLGIQLVGRPGAEGVLIRLAVQIEEARPWRGFRPLDVHRHEAHP